MDATASLASHAVPGRAALLATGATTRSSDGARAMKGQLSADTPPASAPDRLRRSSRPVVPQGPRTRSQKALYADRWSRHRPLFGGIL